MKEKNIWLLKIINPSTDYTLTIYENGLVYGKEYNEKLFIINNETIDEIKKYIKRSLYKLKRQENIIQKTSGFIIKINDTSRKNRNIKVYGWEHEDDIIELIKNKSNIVKSFV
ncbi:MAG: hypothetical protein SPJ74_02775 [Bacilli bacterium]|nr:hypothetical protein [Bacilli bacterium]